MPNLRRVKKRLIRFGAAVEKNIFPSTPTQLNETFARRTCRFGVIKVRACDEQLLASPKSPPSPSGRAGHRECRRRSQELLAVRVPHARAFARANTSGYARTRHDMRSNNPMISDGSLRGIMRSAA